MLYYYRNDLGEIIDPGKTNDSEECMICQYWHFNHGVKYQDSVCNGCHDQLMPCVNVSDTVIISIKEVHYRCIIHSISKSEAIPLLENS